MHGACCLRHTAHCRWNVDCSTALYLHWLTYTHTQTGAACNDRQSWWRHGLAGCMPRCPMPRALHCVSCTSHWDFLPGEHGEQQAEIISLFSGTRAYGKYDSTHTPAHLDSCGVCQCGMPISMFVLHICTFIRPGELAPFWVSCNTSHASTLCAHKSALWGVYLPSVISPLLALCVISPNGRASKLIALLCSASVNCQQIVN